MAHGVGLGSPEELGASCPNSRICGHALSRGNCVPGAPGAPGASRPSSHRQPWSQHHLSHRLFPELQTTGHHCCKPRTLTLASISLFCVACLISRHLPVLKSDKDLRRQHGHHCPLTSDSVHSTDLQLCALLGSSARSRPSFPPPAHLTDMRPGWHHQVKRSAGPTGVFWEGPIKNPPSSSKH